MSRDFIGHLQVSARFMVEDDEEQMKEELKEAFRIYDKEGQGFITTDILKVKKQKKRGWQKRLKDVAISIDG